jgi:hypothetical protein
MHKLGSIISSYSLFFSVTLLGIFWKPKPLYISSSLGSIYYVLSLLSKVFIFRLISYIYELSSLGKLSSATSRPSAILILFSSSYYIFFISSSLLEISYLSLSFNIYQSFLLHFPPLSRNPILVVNPKYYSLSL